MWSGEESVWVVEKSATSLYILYTAEAALLTLLTQLSHTCPREARFTFDNANETACDGQKEAIDSSRVVRQPPSLLLRCSISWGLRTEGRVSLGKAKTTVMSGENAAFLCKHFSLRERCFEEKLELSILSLPQIDVSLLLEF